MHRLPIFRVVRAQNEQHCKCSSDMGETEYRLQSNPCKTNRDHTARRAAQHKQQSLHHHHTPCAADLVYRNCRWNLDLYLRGEESKEGSCQIHRGRRIVDFELKQSCVLLLCDPSAPTKIAPILCWITMYGIKTGNAQSVVGELRSVSEPELLTYMSDSQFRYDLCAPWEC